MILPLIVSEKPVDPMVAEVRISLPMPSSSAGEPYNLASAIWGIFQAERVDYTGDGVSNPEPPKLSLPPEKRSTTNNVGLTKTMEKLAVV